MTLHEQFETASTDVNNLSSRPSNDELLQLYALYKQATIGDVTGSRPGGFDFKGAAKFDAWSKIKGTSSEEAMTAYIALVNNLKEKLSN